jgi:hypothetical protein
VERYTGSNSMILLKERMEGKRKGNRKESNKEKAKKIREKKQR